MGIIINIVWVSVKKKKYIRKWSVTFPIYIFA